MAIDNETTDSPPTIDEVIDKFIKSLVDKKRKVEASEATALRKIVEADIESRMLTTLFPSLKGEALIYRRIEIAIWLRTLAQGS